MSRPVNLSDGEKVILLMLCEIQEHLKVKGDTDTGLVKEAIFSGELERPLPPKADLQFTLSKEELRNRIIEEISALRYPPEGWGTFVVDG